MKKLLILTLIVVATVSARAQHKPYKIKHADTVNVYSNCTEIIRKGKKKIVLIKNQHYLLDVAEVVNIYTDSTLKFKKP